METKISPAPWGLLSSNPHPELPLRRWASLIGAEETERLIADHVLVDLPDEKLNGRIDRYDVGHGLRRYELEFDGEVISALSDGPESPVRVSREAIRTLSFSRAKFLSLLAERNGFKPTSEFEELVPGLFQVGTITLGAERVVTWLLCFDDSRLSSRAAFLLAKERTARDGIVVVSTPNPEQPPSVDWVRDPSIALVDIPSGAFGWMIDARTFCSSAFRFRSQDVAAHLAKFSGVDLLVDEIGEKLFLFGINLDLKPESRSYKYLAKLSRFPNTEESLDQFARQALKYTGIHYDRSWVYDDQKGVKAAIRQQIKDLVLQKRALALFASPGAGKLLLPITSDRILYWS